MHLLREDEHIRAVRGATGTAGTQGSNTLLAAPGAGRFLRLVQVTVQNAAGPMSVVTLASGDDSLATACLEAGDSMIYETPVELEPNTALTLTLDVAADHLWSVLYAVR